MRIISGTHKGRPIHPPTGLQVRPTTDFAKEGLFNVLNNMIDFSQLYQALDLFAGTGSISFELASRQCISVTAVDISRKSIDFIGQTAEKMKLSSIHALRSEVFYFLKHCKLKYDFIFADPPYEMNEKIRVIPEQVFEKGLLSPQGLLIVEHGKRLDLSTHPFFFRHLAYGNVNFSIFTEIQQEN